MAFECADDGLEYTFVIAKACDRKEAGAMPDLDELCAVERGSVMSTSRDRAGCTAFPRRAQSAGSEIRPIATIERRGPQQPDIGFEIREVTDVRGDPGVEIDLSAGDHQKASGRSRAVTH